MGDGTPEQATTAAKKRPWFRFSLRTLLIFVLLCGSGMGLWFRWEPWVLVRTVGDATAEYFQTRQVPLNRMIVIAGSVGPSSSPQGRSIQGTTRVSDLATGAELCTIKGSWSDGILFGMHMPDASADGRWFYTRGPKGETVLVESRTGRVFPTDGREFQIVEFSPDGHFAFATWPLPHDETLVPMALKENHPEVWNLADGCRAASLRIDENIRGFFGVFSPDSKEIIFGARSWNAADGSLIRKFPVAEEFGNTASFWFSPNGRWVLLRGRSGWYGGPWRILVYERATSALVFDCLCDPPSNEFYGDVLITTRNRTSYAHDLSKKPVPSIRLDGVAISAAVGQGQRRCVTISGEFENGNSCRSPVLHIYNLDTGASEAHLTGLPSIVFPYVRALSETVVLSFGSQDNHVVFWNPKANASIVRPGIVAVSPDGIRAAVASNGTLSIFSLNPIRELWSSNLPDQIKHLEFSSDGSYLVASGQRASIYVRRRSEYRWGVACLPEFWLTVLFAPALVWSVWRDRRTL